MGRIDAWVRTEITREEDMYVDVCPIALDPETWKLPAVEVHESPNVRAPIRETVARQESHTLNVTGTGAGKIIHMIVVCKTADERR